MKQQQQDIKCELGINEDSEREVGWTHLDMP